MFKISSFFIPSILNQLQFQSVSVKLEPFVPPIAIQSSQQASLPNVISINYDVPRAGVTQELEALKNAPSFLQLESKFDTSAGNFNQNELAMARTDVFFDPPPSPELIEQEYQKSLAKVCSSIKSKIHEDRRSNLHHTSFLQDLNASDTIHFFVDQHAKGRDIDMMRLKSDAYVCGSEAIIASSFLQVPKVVMKDRTNTDDDATSFLQAHGDEVPRPAPVLNVDIDVRKM